MKIEVRAFLFALGISIGLLFVFFGNILVIGGMFGDVFIWKEIIIGIILLFIGFLLIFITINSSESKSQENKNE